ncbi:MAG: hypothetical protein NVS2B4_17470 [Ramlibacter sp.]
MSSRPLRPTASIAQQAAELAFAVPQVVAHRMTRMAIAGPTLSPRDRKEFTRMVAEKNTAFASSWQAMAAQAVVANQALASSFMRSFWSPPQMPMHTLTQVQNAALGVLGKGMAPVHRKAVANAKRLAKTRLR